MKILGKHVFAAMIGFTTISMPIAAIADDLFGSIAYSQQTRAYGWSKDYGSQAEAESAAMTECNKRAGDCKIAMSYQNACGAVAVGQDGGWGSDWGRDANAANNKAMHMCDGYSYICKVVVTQCVTGVQ